jgi:hypothetical protein
MLLTAGIAIAGFRTFERWREEKLEEKRIEIAIEALALVYESRFIFDHLRSGFVFDSEASDLPRRYGDTDEIWRARGRYFAILKRIDANREFFERAWKIQVRCTAIFGPHVENVFLLLQKARRYVEVSAAALADHPEPDIATEDNRRTWQEWRDDVWAPQAVMVGHNDRVGKLLSDFREQVEKLCRPIVAEKFRRPVARWFSIQKLLRT